MRLSARSTSIDFDEKYETGYCIPLWLRDLQVKQNIKRIKDRVELHEGKRPEDIAVVGYGPSLKKTWKEIKKFKYIITTSGAHQFLIEKGIIPTWHLDVDPRSHKVKLLGKVHKDVIYTPCSTVHKSYIDALVKAKAKIKLWHCFSTDQDAMRILDQGEFALTGGCDAGMRAMSLARFMGFVNLHVFGMDGSYDDGYHAGYHSNPIKKVFDLEYPKGSGNIFKTSPHLMEVAKTVPHEVNMLKLDSVKFYGDGFVSALMKNHKLERPKVSNIAFQRPVLITEKSLRKFKRLHKTVEYGASGHKQAEIIKKLVEKCKFESVLDYGCGKGTLASHLSFPIWEYDPAIEGKDTQPRQADLVVCIDVLDEVEKENLEDVICDLKGLTKKVGYFIVKDKSFVKPLSKYFGVASVKEFEGKIQILVGPKIQKPKAESKKVEMVDEVVKINVPKINTNYIHTNYVF